MCVFDIRDHPPLWEARASLSGVHPRNQAGSMGYLLLKQVPKIWQPLIAASCGVAESLSKLSMNPFPHWEQPRHDFLR